MNATEDCFKVGSRGQLDSGVLQLLACSFGKIVHIHAATTTRLLIAHDQEHNDYADRT